MASSDLRLFQLHLEATEVYDSTGVVIIVTTEDKLRLRLNSYEQVCNQVQNSKVPRFRYLSLFVALAAAEATDPSADWLPTVVFGSSFKSSFFGVGAVVILIWWVSSEYRARKERVDPMSVNDVVQKLKDESQTIVSTVTRGDEQQGAVPTPSAAAIGATTDG